LWTVENEAFHDGVGRIDLLLELRQPVYGIAIENKIYAGEQPTQVGRYAEFLSSRFGTNACIFYLTLHGEKSQTHGDRPYIRISYANQVLCWLEKCLCATALIAPIHQVLLQYEKVVRYLTGKNVDAAIMKNIAEFIAQHPDIIRFRRQIEDAIAVARADFLDRLAKGIEEGLQAEFRVCRYAHLKEDRFGVDPNGALVITPPQTSPLHGAPFEIWVQHIDQWNAVLIGMVADFSQPGFSANAERLKAGEKHSGSEDARA
jgi:hypothetical protein